MARFLDRMVSDLIRKNTGINVRPFVRMVGGKNLLLLGGAAVAGLVAADKMPSNRAATPTPPGSPPPPPDAGQAGPPRLPASSSPPPLPPIPAPPREEEVADPSEIPQPLLFAVVRTMVAAALSDGEMSAQERAVIQSHLNDSGLPPEQIQQVHKELLVPASPADIVRGVDSEDDRRLVYRFGVLVAASDDEIVDAERKWLATLAQALSLSSTEVDALDKEVFPGH